jgi:deoxyadenosine/deoxycytidine kinase
MNRLWPSSQVWQPPAVNENAPKARYVCVTGNSGTGKSTTVSRLSKDLFHDKPVIGIDERSTHHPFLDMLFNYPTNYAYELQLNFMLQRILIARRWLASGTNVIMERSHLDDPIFVAYLRSQNLITDHEQAVYLDLWTALNARTPIPDALVILMASPEVSISRVTDAENNDLRPREFRSEQHKVDWITGWSKLYAERTAALARDQIYGDRVGIFSASDSYEDIRNFVLSKVEHGGP